MLITFLLSLLPSAQNLIVNGDFETNTTASCEFNLTNGTFSSKMTGCAGFGVRNEIDIMEDPGGCGYGPGAPVGATKLGIACNADADVDAFTMTLSSPLTPGDSYTLSFWAYGYISSFSTALASVDIGLAAAPGTTGTIFFTGVPSSAGFIKIETSFVAPSAAGYLSVSCDAFVDGWTHVDGFVLEKAGLHLDLAGSCPGMTTATITGATPGGSVAVGYSATAGSFTIPPAFTCGGTVMGLGGHPAIAAVVSANGAGTATLSGPVPAALCGFSVQAVDLTSCDTSNVGIL